VKREENGRTCKERKEAEENLFLQTENREKVSSAKVAGGGEGVLLSSDAVPRDLAEGTLVPSELAEFSVVALVEGAFEVAKLVVVEAVVYGKRGSVERDEGGEGRVRTLVVKLLVVVLVVLLLVVVVLLVVVLLIVVCGREKSQRERLGYQRGRAHHRSPSCRRLRGKGENGQLVVRQRRKKQHTLLVVLVLVFIIVVIVWGRENVSTGRRKRGKGANSHACSACRRPCHRR
jgi:uncharacterized membrane protein